MPMYDFKCEDCGHETNIMCKYSELPKKVNCEKCESGNTYRLLGVSMIKSSYDQNGRLAVQVNLGNGKIIRRSKTREHYERTGKNEPQYTKGYKEYLKKKNQKRETK